ncbi:UDP-glucose/GDP-mannose dehydrogenase family protein [Mesobacillus maritimus]|uniref:UDP-glucose/GDP-mannose dehydrogenase family protein n=1 Tax=Mesobacillus maritimus TaxID=1643336 RepID=UPI002042474D|nr:UDP-glucose/GDP-mannose dehydrogenase family protein [Mesobacillus maritimus]MCM3670910.1 UDP-glucose/GDP-mannose dehydrogenase family protein [Mesobacillus maritimus]
MEPDGVNYFKKVYSDEIAYCNSIEENLKDADICFIFTEWDEVKDFDLARYSELMKTASILDGRNCYDLSSAKKANMVSLLVERQLIV